MKSARNGSRPTAKALMSHMRLLGLVLGGLLLTTLLSGCPKSYPDCDEDGTCASHGEVCVQNKCRQCRDDSQCTKLDACLTCQANECVKRPGCCKSALDCPNGKCWRDPANPSAPGTCGGQCQTASDCPAGQRCANGSCVPDIACTDDAFCPEGQRCIDGRCAIVPCTPQPIYFDFNEYVIRLDQEQAVADNAACLKQRTTERFVTEGHCDERGSDEYNLALGQRRAATVVRQYQTLGANRAHINVISYGEEKPVCTDARESCWSQNRRVETNPK